ncbi:hypothetical protein SKM52_12335 [Acinetobacter faecalis]|uniref:hypothetical protein n=1 Tax=Acinetobacter faecalis TaxID=2665161 RepID=UPI002A91DD48|nr:hypothetical protein [Acinetobacter faecalis]MDY6525303.1 hypothetical protein [Acinetobacter faecalis]
MKLSQILLATTIAAAAATSFAASTEQTPTQNAEAVVAQEQGTDASAPVAAFEVATSETVAQ